MAGSALAAKNQCPFCDVHLERTDTYEYSIKTIIKMVSYFREHSAALKEVNKRLYYKSLMCMRDNEVPGPIRAIYPSMSFQRYQERLTDPLFLYEYTRVCETCYEYLQRVLKSIDRETDTPDISVSASTPAAGMRTISSISRARDGSPFVSSQRVENIKRLQVFMSKTSTPSKAIREEEEEQEPGEENSSKQTTILHEEPADSRKRASKEGAKNLASQFVICTDDVLADEGRVVADASTRRREA